MKLKSVFFALAVIVLVYLAFNVSFAGGKKMPPPPTTVKTYNTTNNTTNTTKLSSVSDAVSESSSMADASALSDASASNEGNSFDGGDNLSLVAVPNNNTADCTRVWGVVLFSIPYSSASCDYEEAARAADAQGNTDLAWFWRCHKRNMNKVFKQKDRTKADRIIACHQYTVGEMANTAVINRLKQDLAFIQNERKIERQKCDESMDRCMDSWKKSAEK